MRNRQLSRNFTGNSESKRVDKRILACEPQGFEYSAKRAFHYSDELKPLVEKVTCFLSRGFALNHQKFDFDLRSQMLGLALLVSQFGSWRKEALQMHPPTHLPVSCGARSGNRPQDSNRDVAFCEEVVMRSGSLFVHVFCSWGESWELICCSLDPCTVTLGMHTSMAVDSGSRAD